ERKIDRPAQPNGGLDLPRVSPERPQHQVGEHDRDADRDQRLPQLLPFHPAKNEDLEKNAEERGNDESDHEAEEPGAGSVDGHVSEIAAQEVDGAMRQINVAHQAEDQGEPARDQEIEPAKRDPVQARVKEELLSAEHGLDASRPRREDEPDEGDDNDEN